MIDLTDWPTLHGRLLCTTTKPMPADAPGRWIHPEAVDDGSCAEGCCDDFRCPACGVRWREELPQ